MRRAAALAVLLLIALGAGAAETCSQIFDGPIGIPLPPGTTRPVIAAEVTGDGRADLIVGGERIAFIPQLPGLTFGPPVSFDTFPKDSTTRSVAATDLDGDGWDEVIVYEHAKYDAAARRIRVYANVHGTLQRSLEIPVVAAAGYEGRVLAGDFNGDGKHDFAFAGPGSIAVHLFAGNGAGNVTDIATQTGELGGIAAAGDLDADGIDDLIVQRPASIAVLFGSAGGFLAPKEVAVSGYTTNLTVTDIDRDGDGDALYQRDSGASFWGFDARAAAPVPFVRNLRQPTYDGDFLYDDFTGEGVVDVGLVGAYGTLRVFAKRSDTLYEPVAEYLGYGKSGILYDMDGDGTRDVVTAGYSHISIILRPNGIPRSPRSFAAISVGTRALGVADFNGDGRDDLFATDGYVYLSQPEGTFARAELLLVWPTPPLFGDVNGDGNVDIVIASNSEVPLPPALYVSVFLGRGDGTFIPLPMFTTPKRIRQGGNAFLADVDFDGRLDLVAGAVDPLVEPPALAVAPGRGDGTFGAFQVSSLGKTPSGAVADFNGDSRPDLWLSGSVRLNLGTSWGENKPVAITFSPDAFADVNHDGRADIIGVQGSVALVALSRGDGTFAPQTSSGQGPKWFDGPVFVADFNRDGNPDILGTETDLSSGDVGIAALFEGDGAGRFGAPRIVPTNDRNGPFLSGDFNGDGRPDLVNGAFVRTNVCVLPEPRRRSVHH